ncbi:interleukin-22 [Tiliqua scincoides]|uniref:interleukin-22 n=1 Tax=Tiliqua scincoides TaxID=71010 RepID=UPI003461E4DA
MNPVLKWMRFSFAWMLFCACLPLLFFASPLPLKEGHTHANHSCVLEKDIFQRAYIRNRTYTLAKLARFSDADTDNRFIRQHLYTNIQKEDHCYLMMRVTDIVVTNVLSKLKEQYPSAQEVAFFFTHLNTKLSDCKPLGSQEHLEKNLEEMKDKLIKLGENGKNKAVGELDLLFDYLENACTEAPKKTSKSEKKN